MNAMTTMTASTTTTPEQVTPPGVAVPPLPSDALADLVARYEAKWPEIAYAKGGSRARKAMQYVLEGRCQQAGTDDLGNDIWIVNGNRCSKVGKWCECEDRIRTDATYGKLCAHRLAVALKTHWDGDRNDHLVTALATLLQYNARRLDLLVERTYAHHGDGERTVLVGWIDENRQRQTWPPALHVPFTLPQFQNALRAFGWWGYPGLPTQWQVVDLCRIWIDPDLQPGGRWCDPYTVPGFYDRRGKFRPTTPTWAINEVLQRVQADRVRLWPPVYLDQPYHIRLAISYHDPQYHRGTIYRHSHATPMYTDASGNPTPGSSGKFGWCWPLPAPAWEWGNLADLRARQIRMI